MPQDPRTIPGTTVYLKRGFNLWVDWADLDGGHSEARHIPTCCRGTVLSTKIYPEALGVENPVPRVEWHAFADVKIQIETLFYSRKLALSLDEVAAAALAQ